MSTIFLTGFPGFIGSALIKRLLDRYPAEVTVTCLIQPKFRVLAEQRIKELEVGRPEWQGRILLCEGDITLPELGLGPRLVGLQDEIIEIFHLAAVYDLGVGRELAMRVNVNGTRNMLNFAEICPNLHRFQYISTCYVSGRYNGGFTEEMLIVNQQFNNHYEETKYLAEVETQKYLKAGLPITIYRPSIVIGDSQTGATQKYDGPYYVLQWILRQWRLAVVPVSGDTRLYEVNVVPRNYVVDAIAYLSGLEKSQGQVYHLCDPKPLTVDELLDEIGRATGRKLLRVPLPKIVAKGALEYLPGVQWLTRIEPEAVEYFTQPTRYTCTNTLRDLAGSGIICPRIPEYLNRLIAFMEAHPNIPSTAMI